MTHFFFRILTKWPYDQMTICCVLCLCLFLNKVLLGLRTLCQHGRRQAAPRHIKLRSVCKASWRSDAVLMPRVGAITEIGHRMWRRQVAQAPITTIVRAVDAILIHGSMAHGELWKTQTDFSEYVFLNSNYFLNTNYIFWTRIFWTWITRFFLIENIAKQLRFVKFAYSCSKTIRVQNPFVFKTHSCSKKHLCSKFKNQADMQLIMQKLLAMAVSTVMTKLMIVFKVSFFIALIF